MFFHQEDRELGIQAYHLSVENQANQQANHQYIVQELVKLRQEIGELKLSVSYHSQIANEKSVETIVKKKPGRKKKSG